MTFKNAFIPYSTYWSTPFARWQGSLSDQHSMKLAAETAKTYLQGRDITANAFDGLVLGMTVPQHQSFYGAPWMSGMLGAPEITGPTIAQACATSVRMIATSATEIEAGQRTSILNIACDRTSNGAHIYYPAPKGIGGMGVSENIVFDSFNHDPFAKNPMIQTAENVAARTGISKGAQDAIALIRHEQYQMALADDRAFQKRYMVPVELKRGRKVIGTLEADEGIHPTNAEGLAKLRPVLPEGSVSFGSQTHPADGNAGIVVATEEQAAQMSADASIKIQILAYGEARVEKGFMPMAVVPAAYKALERSGISIQECGAVKTHNPFAVNDAYFCNKTGLDPQKMNRYGSPLIYGHPQAPTGLRAIIELIEELVISGGGYGLFSGCAAGDSAMALVLKVDG